MSLLALPLASHSQQSRAAPAPLSPAATAGKSLAEELGKLAAIPNPADPSKANSPWLGPPRVAHRVCWEARRG